MEPKKFKTIDLSYIEELANGSEEFINEMINTFLIETPEDLSCLEKYYKLKEWSALRSTAHKMKSSISIMGLNELIPVIKNIEEYASSETNLNLLAELIDKTTTICKEAMKELENEI